MSAVVTSPAGETAAPPQLTPQDHLMQLGFGYMISATLSAIVELRVADQLENGPRSAEELAASVGAKADILARMMRTLESAGVFARTRDGKWMLTPISDLMRTSHPQSMHRLLHWGTSPQHFQAYANALHTAKTGEPALEYTTNKSCFEALASTPREQNSFNDAMTAISEMVMPAVLAAYDFSPIGKIVDIAGGHGFVLASILAAHPHMRGMLYELDYVAEGARARFESMGLSDRCEVCTGDFFSHVPSGADAYVMKHILHDWNDERAGQILRNIRSAMGPAKGKVILIEAVVPEAPVPHMAKIMDIEMMMYPGGKERTESEWRELFAANGFRLSRIVATQSPMSVIEAVAV